MSRLIRCTDDGPYELKPQTESVWLCRCGLSQNKPFCDSAHMFARKEEDGRLYVYSELTQQPIGDTPDCQELSDLLPPDSGSKDDKTSS